MEAVICGATALDFWRRHSDPSGEVQTAWKTFPARKGPLHIDTPSAALAEDFACWLGIDLGEQGLELLITDQAHAHRLDGVVRTTCSGPVPGKSLVRLHGQAYASTPEFTFLLLARRLELVPLLEIGFELCGTYRMIDGRPEYGCAPLTSASKLRAFASRAKGIGGRTAALRACQRILDGSASPAETALAILFGLPYREGGSGLRDFVLNCELQLNEGASFIMGRHIIHPDIYFVKAKHPVEYDGPMFHSGLLQGSYDERRRAAYNAMGMSVSIFQAQHMSNFALFDEMVRAVRRQTGQRQNRVPADYELRKLRLQEAALRYWNSPRDALASGAHSGSENRGSWYFEAA